MQRTSHALAVDGRVWLFDVVDAAGLDDRVRELGRACRCVQLLDRHNRDCAAFARRLGVPLTSSRGRCPTRRSSSGPSCGSAGGARWRSGGRSAGSCSRRRARDDPVLPRRRRAGRSPPAAAALAAALAPRPRASTTCSSGTAKVCTHHPAALESALRTARRRIPRWLLALPRMCARATRRVWRNGARRRPGGTAAISPNPRLAHRARASRPGRTRRGGAFRPASRTGGFDGSASGAAANEAARRSAGASA